MRKSALDLSETSSAAEGKQVGIETQASDDTGMIANCSEEFDGCKRAVGDQYDVPIGEPKMDLQGGLAHPIRQRLGLPASYRAQRLHDEGQAERTPQWFA